MRYLEGVLFLLFLASCTSSTNLSRCGRIVLRHSVWDNVIGKKVTGDPVPNLKLWYKDSLVIEQINYLYFEDSLGVKKAKSKTDHYTFINLPRRSFYDYTSFSDTARLIKKYTQPDSVKVFSGWTFYAYHNLPRSKEPRPMTDTVMDGVTYQRMELTNEIKTNQDTSKLVTVVYFRCDKKGTMFQSDKLLSEKVGCPMVKLHQQPSKTQVYSITEEIDFVSSSLSEEELKVILAWEKFATQNPPR